MSSTSTPPAKSRIAPLCLKREFVLALQPFLMGYFDHHYNDLVKCKDGIMTISTNKYYSNNTSSVLDTILCEGHVYVL